MKCKTKGCKNEARQRGICLSCYAVVYRAVAAGKTTWKDAESAGLVLPPQRKRSPMNELIEKL